MNLKCFDSIVSLRLVVSLSLTVFAGAVHAAPAPGKAAAASGEVRLVHNLGVERDAALQALAQRFNESSKGFKVKVQQGGLTEGETAHMLILDGEDSERFLSGKPRFKPLHAAMHEAGVPLRTLKPPPVLSRTAVDAKGQLRALPVGLSTPVLFVNRDVLGKAGLNPDAPLPTWTKLQQALDKLFDAGGTCPYTVSQPARVMIENTSAWHNEPTSAMQGKILQPSFNNMLQVKHVALMASWHRARFMRIFETDREAEERFVAGECSVIAAPSSNWAGFRRKAGFDIGIMPLPYHDDMFGSPQNTLADGATLWFAAGKQKAEYKAMAAFVDFWLQPPNQIAWQLESGYLPLNRAGFFAAQSDLLGGDLANVQVAVSQLTNKPATAQSSAAAAIGGARVIGIVDAALRDVWAERKPAKLALDEAVMAARVPVPKGK